MLHITEPLDEDWDSALKLHNSGSNSGPTLVWPWASGFNSLCLCFFLCEGTCAQRMTPEVVDGSDSCCLPPFLKYPVGTPISPSGADKDRAGFGGGSTAPGRAECRPLVALQDSPSLCGCSAAQPRTALCHPMDCSAPGFPILHSLLKVA